MAKIHKINKKKPPKILYPTHQGRNPTYSFPNQQGEYKGVG